MPTVGDFYNVAMEFETTDSGKMFNIYDFILLNGDCTDAQLLTALSSIITSAYTYLLGYIHSTVSVQTSKVNQVIWSGTEWVVQRYVGTILPSLTFAGTSDALPHATSALVQFLTTVPRVVGKKYLPVFSELYQSGSFLTGAALTAMLQYGAAMTASVAAGAGDLYYTILRKNGSYAGIYGEAANGTISSQRKRKPGVGV